MEFSIPRFSGKSFHTTMNNEEEDEDEDEDILFVPIPNNAVVFLASKLYNQ